MTHNGFNKSSYNHIIDVIVRLCDILSSPIHLESEYNDVEHRVSRVRAAMFSDWDAGPSTSLATRSSIIETVSVARR